MFTRRIAGALALLTISVSPRAVAAQLEPNR
jgi:hypothetical protein